MKKIIATALCLSFFYFSFAQNPEVKRMVDSLQLMKADTLDCSADLYWRIIAKGKSAIPYLIDKLTDTTQTNVKYHCKTTRLNVGEVAQFALIQIASFPAYAVNHLQFEDVIIDETGEGCWSFYDWLFINSHKQLYQKNMKVWYQKEKSKYKTEIIPTDKQTDCQKQYGIKRFYHWVQT